MTKLSKSMWKHRRLIQALTVVLWFGCAAVGIYWNVPFLKWTGIIAVGYSAVYLIAHYALMRFHPTYNEYMEIGAEIVDEIYNSDFSEA